MSQNALTQKTPLALKFTGITLASIAISLSVAQAQTQWTGTTNSDPTVSTNYLSGVAPTYGSSIAGNLSIADGVAGSAMTYGAAQGSTSFGGNIRVGSTLGGGAAPSSELNVTGGALTINSAGTSTMGFQGSGTITVSGGSLTINGTDQFWFGNDQAATANVSGGTFTVGNGFLFSRNGGASTINLSGNGLFDVTGTSGTAYNSNGGSGLATINLGGSGIFRQSGSNAINLGGNFTINFTSETSQLALLGSNTAQLNALITGGQLRINGVSNTTLSNYVVTGAPDGSSLGTIQLAAVPEPGTWGLIMGGMLGLLIWNRRRTLKA